MTTSPARIYPELKLAAAICKQAILDLRDRDPITALDALGWFLTDGPIYLKALGFSISDFDVFVKVCER